MYKPSYKPISEALHAALAREGVYVGGTAGYPRVELHTFIEASPLDKGDSVRTLTCTIESVSNTSMEAAAGMNGDNMQLLGSFTYTDAEFSVIGIVPTQLQDITENTDSQKVLYHVFQTVDIYVQQL